MRPVIINDNEEYRSRSYWNFGYSVDVSGNKFEDYFPKIQLQDDELEEKIFLIETRNRDSSHFFIRLLDGQTHWYNGAWSLPNSKGPGTWRKAPQNLKHRRDEYYVFTVAGLISFYDIYADDLYPVETKGNGRFIYSNGFPDIGLAYAPKSARLLSRVSTFHFANLLSFKLQCFEHVCDPKWFDLVPKTNRLFDFLKALIPIAKEFSLEEQNATVIFRLFLERNYPDLFQQSLDLGNDLEELTSHLSWNV